MQLSLPPTLPTVSDVTAAGPSAANSLGGIPTGTTPPDSFGASFETLLQGDDSESESVDQPDESAAANAAALFAGLLWTPAPALPQDPKVLLGSEQAPKGDATTTASLFAAAPSARAYAAIPPESRQINSAGPTVAETPPAVAMLAPTNATALPAGENAATFSVSPGQSKPPGVPLPPEQVEPAVTQETANPAPVPMANQAQAATAVAPAAPRGTLVTKVEKNSGEVGKVTMPTEELIQAMQAEATSPLGASVGPQSAPDQSAKTAKFSGQEKNAAGEALVGESSAAIKQVGEKYFLSSGYKPVTTRAGGVGTGIAKVDATMSAPASSRAKFELSSELMQTMSVTNGAPSPSVTGSSALLPSSSVRETMATVVSVVDALERRDAAEQKSVNLQLKVGDEALALRVELRDGTVHTTFRTESAELRTALAQAWQSVSTQVENRTQRLAEPVFTSGPHDSLAAGDGGAQQQRDPGAQPNLPQAAGFSRRRPVGVVATESVEAARPAVQTATNNARLHTFA